MDGTLAESNLSPIHNLFQSQSLEAVGVGRIEVAKSVATDTSEAAERFFSKLIEQPRLLQLIQTFAHRPQDWIHPSKFDAGAFPLSEEATSERLQLKVATGIGQSFDLADLNYELFDNQAWRLALLDIDTLTTLATRIGLIHLIQNLDPTQPQQRTTIVNSIGEVALQSFTTMASEMNFSLTTRIPKEWDEDLDQAMQVVGWQTIGSVFTSAPKSLTKRIELKAPREITKWLRSGRKKPGMEEAAAAHMSSSVLQHTDPSHELLCIF